MVHTEWNDIGSNAAAAESKINQILNKLNQTSFDC